MSNQFELEAKTQQAPEETSITPSGEQILAQIGINLTTLKATQQGMERSCYRAVINWLTKYKPPLEASNLEKVKGYLEACYHLFELEAWAVTITLLSIRFNTFNNQELGIQLGHWGYYREQIDLYGKLLGKLNHRIDAICLKSLGIAYRWLTDFREAQNHLHQALAIFKGMGDKQNSAEILHELGLLQADNGEDLEALTYYNQALVNFRESRQHQAIVSVLNDIARVYTNQNSYTEVEKIYQEIQEIYNNYLAEDKTKISYAWVLYDWGRSLADRCKNLEAFEYTSEALNMFQKLENSSGIAWSLYSLSILMLNLGKDSSAYDYITAALDLFRQLLNKNGIALSCHILGRVAFRQKNYKLVRDCYKEKMKIWHESQNLAGIALALEGFAHLAVVLDHPERAARLFGTAEILRDKTQLLLPPADLREYRDSIATIQTVIGEAALKTAWDVGRVLSVEQAIAEALGSDT